MIYDLLFMIQQTYHATMTIKLDINHNSEIRNN